MRTSWRTRALLLAVSLLALGLGACRANCHDPFGCYQPCDLIERKERWSSPKGLAFGCYQPCDLIEGRCEAGCGPSLCGTCDPCGR